MKNTFDDYVTHWRKAEAASQELDAWQASFDDRRHEIPINEFAEAHARAAAAQVDATLALATAVTRLVDSFDTWRTGYS